MVRAVHIILLLACFPAWLVGQQSEMKTLLSDGARISAFGSINGGVNLFNHTYVGYIGGDGALVLNNFYLGGYGSRNVGFHEVYPEDEYYADKKLGLSQGGIMAGVSFGSKKMLQYAVGGQIGWGHLSLRDNTDKKILTRDRVNIFTPTFQAKLNITSYMQLCLGASYQFLIGVDFPKLEDRDFQGLCGSISLRFGWF